MHGSFCTFNTNRVLSLFYLLCVAFCHTVISCLLQVTIVSIEVKLKNVMVQEMKPSFDSTPKHSLAKKEIVIEERAWLSEMI